MAAPAIHCFEIGTGASAAAVIAKPGAGSTAGPDGAKDPVAGDYLLAVLANDQTTASVTWTPPDGTWTQISTGDVGDATSDCHCTAYIKKLDGTEGSDFTFTFVTASPDLVGCLILLSGVEQTQADALHGQGSDVIDSTPPIAITGFTSTVDDVVAFAIWAYDGADSGAMTVSGTGWTELLEMRRGTAATGESGGVAYKKMSGTGATGTCTVSVALSDGMAGVQFGIAPAIAPAEATYINDFSTTVSSAESITSSNSGSVADDVIVVVLDPATTGKTITPPDASWHLLDGSIFSDQELQVWVHRRLASEPTWTFTWTGAMSCRAHQWIVRGVPLNVPITDAVRADFVTGTGTANVATASIDAADATGNVVGIWTCVSATGTINTAPTGFSSSINLTGYGAYRDITNAAGTLSATGAVRSSSDDHLAVLLAVSQFPGEPTRVFDGADDQIVCSVGAVTQATANRTFAAIIRRTGSGGWGAFISLKAGTDHGAAIGFDDANQLIVRIDGGSDYAWSSFTITQADGWVLVAVGKDSGTAIPRMHKCVLSTGTWTHQDGSHAIGNGTYGSTDDIRLGSLPGDYLAGAMAVAGIFPGNLSDGTVETLKTGLQEGLDAAADALWPLNQASIGTAVEDITGNGANQSSLTGTTVDTATSVPEFDWEVDAGVSITPDSATHVHTATQPALTQVHSIQPNNATHGHVASQPALTQTHILAPANANHGHAATEPSLAIIVSIEPDDAIHDHTAEQPTVTGDIVPDAAVHTHIATEPSLTQIHEVIPNDAVHAHSATEPAVIQVQIVTPDDAIHGHTVSQPSVAQISNFAPDAATHAHTATQPSLTQVHEIQPDNATHAHVATQPTTNIVVTITPNDAVHGHISTSPSITQLHVIAPNNAIHSHTATQPSISGEGEFAPDFATHAHTATQPILTQIHIIQPDNATHQMVATVPVLTQTHIVEPADTIHDHQATAPTLGQLHILVAEDAEHTHISTSPFVVAIEVAQVTFFINNGVPQPVKDIYVIINGQAVPADVIGVGNVPVYSEEP